MKEGHPKIQTKKQNVGTTPQEDDKIRDFVTKILKIISTNAQHTTVH